MKKVIFNLFALVVFFHLSCMKNEKVISSNQSKTTPRSPYGGLSGNVNENMAYPDTYPESDNLPPPKIAASYSPDEQNMIRLEFSNPANYNPSGVFSPYFQLQYRKLIGVYNNNYNAESKWYNYHPTLQAYDALRVDTFNTQYHPSFGNCFFEINPKIFPVGPIQFRARLIYPELYSPIYPWQRGRATLWSNISNEGLVSNPYGAFFWNEEHDPTGETTGTIVTANVQIDLNVDVTNNSTEAVGDIMVSAFGTTTHYNYSLSVHGVMSIAAKLNEPRIFSNDVTVIVRSTTGNTLASVFRKFYNQIYVSSSMGSNPTFYFVENVSIDIDDE